MADVNKEILILFNVETGEFETSLGKTGKGLDALGKSIDNTTTKFKQTSTEAQKAAKVLQTDFDRAAGLAGATTMELGRTISDLPFGLTAVTNNISQLGNLFFALVANTGSVRNAFASLWTQIMGPVGLVLAFQVVIALVQRFAGAQKAAEDSIKEFSNAAILQGKTLVELRELFLEIEGPLAKQLELIKALALEDENLTAILENQNISQRQQVELAREYIVALEDLRKREEQVIANKKKIEKANEDLNISEEQLQKNQREINRLRGQSDPRGNIADRIFELENENRTIREQLDLLTSVSRQLNFIASERERIKELATERTDFVFLTEEEYETQQDLAEKNTDLIEDYRQKLLELATATEVERLEAQRQGALKRIESAQGSKEAEVAINAFFDEKINQARREAAEEAAKDRQTELDKEIKALERSLREKDKLFQRELRAFERFVVDQRNLIVLRREVQALETGDDRGFLEWKKSFFERLSKDQAFSVTERLRFKRIYLEIDKQLKEEEIASDEALAEKKRAQQEYLIGLAQEFFDSVIALSDAQMKAEIDREKAKTIALNDELRERLRNEQLSAEERDKINQEIAQNEAALIEKQNELERKRFEQQKAANIANAVISTYLAASQALANPLELSGPLKIASAALVIASGLANVAAIASQEFVPRAAPNPALTAQGGGTGAAAPEFNVVGASSQNQLASAIAGQTERPVKAFVVSSDVSSAQELERNIIEGASI